MPPSPPASPIDIQQTLIEAVHHHSNGRLQEARDMYQAILELDPQEPNALNLLAMIAMAEGDPEAADHLLRKAIATSPDFAEAHFNLGNSLQARGQGEQAIDCYRQAIRVRNDYADAYRALGNVLKDLGNREEALHAYDEAVRIKPDSAEVHFNRGLVLAELNRPDEALASYRTVVSLLPDYADTYNNMGTVLKNQHRLDEAALCFNKAIALKPDYVVAYNNLGVLLKDQGKLDEAVAVLQKALALNPEFADLNFNLSNVLHEQGDADAAALQLEQAIRNKPQSDGWRIRKALLLPIIPSSNEDILARRQALQETVAALLQETLVVDDPAKQVCATNFYLAYHHLDNRELMQSITSLHRAACPELAFEAPHCRRQTGPAKNGRLKIGILSAYLCNHTIGKFTQGLIEHLSRDRFEVAVLQVPGQRDWLTEQVEQSADRVIGLAGHLQTDRHAIADAALDILFYPDIGMSYYTYFLSFARLAPVQMVSWGHPDTTGNPNMDYFISSELIEPEGADAHYSEQLLQLSLLPVFYRRPEPPEHPARRSDFGLPEQGALYVCPQTLFKLHPDFDGLIAKLLRHDAEGWLVLIDDGKGGSWNRLITERLGRLAPDVVDRVRFVARMTNDKFLGLLMLADALLDVPTYSGGNSSLEAFALAAPIVTRPGSFMRSRVTAGCYRQMGLSDLIALDDETYVALAFELAHNAEFKSRMQTDIRDNAPKLFERMEVVREIETLFTNAHAALGRRHFK